MHKIAFIEAPIQCLLLVANNSDLISVEIFLVRRRSWPVNEALILRFFNKKNISVINTIRAFWILISRRKNCSSVTFGSHLGVQNRILIVASLILNYKVCVLDDGIYSINKPDWMLLCCRIFKNLHWSSYFFREYGNSAISTYCLTTYSSCSYYNNTWFLVLSDFSGLGISKVKEELLIGKVLNRARENGMGLIVLPHRRGRFQLYKDMGLTLLSTESICFEEWYLKSSFENCRIIASASSIWQVLEDARVETTLIDLGFSKFNWIKDRVNVESIIQV